ncbi:MAG: hypothetical protein OIN86_07925 [Candidatus Methanoperedens sp.]|nr:hypothetical protein [Candidatus Methanoperedens sp.]CAG0975832.1 hypothetical protein METP1_01498 [Methanosarcinales archaeon]
MSTEGIALFIIIVFLFIIAIYQFILLRKSHEKKQRQEPKKFEYKDIVDITPEFKFETSDNVEIHPIKDLIKPVTDVGIAETDAETISIEEKIRRQKRFPELENKTQEIIDEIPKTTLNMMESHSKEIESHVKEDLNVPLVMMEDVSGLKLEDTLIEEEKKKRRKTVTKKSDPNIKTAIVPQAKPLIGEKRVRKKKSVKEEPVEVEHGKRTPGKPMK